MTRKDKEALAGLIGRMSVYDVMMTYADILQEHAHHLQSHHARDPETEEQIRMLHEVASDIRSLMAKYETDA